MENKYNYALVGLFVIGFIAAFITIVVWLTVGTQKVVYLPYQVISNESVSGLSINSTVDYSGVDVGKVIGIELDKMNPKNVIITLDIKQGTPIKADTEAVLIGKGVTGLINVGLTGGTADAPDIIPSRTNPVPIIKTGPSLSKRLDEAFNSITASILKLSDQLSKVINDENTVHITNTLNNIEIITANLADSSDDLKNILANSSDIINRAKPKVDTVFNAIDTFDEITGEVKKAAKELDRFLNSFNKVFNDWSTTAKEWTILATSTKTLLPSVNGITKELRGSLNQLGQLLQEIKQQPNTLIMGRKQNPKGPGE